MQALFAPKKKLSQHLQAGGQVFAARIIFYLRGLRRASIGFKRQKKSREIRQLKIFWNFKEI